MPLMRRRYLVGFVAATAILALVGCALLAGVQRYRHDSETVARALEVINSIQKVHADLLQAVASQRSYLLTGDTSYRDLHGAAAERIRLGLPALERLVADNAKQQAEVRKWAMLIRQRLQTTREAIALYESHGLDAARSYARTNRSLEVSLAIEEQAMAMLQAEEDLLMQRRDSAERSQRLLTALVATGIPLSLAILAWVYLLLLREVRERARVEREAQALNERMASSVAALERASGEMRELSRYAGMLQTCRNIPEALDVTRRVLMLLMPRAAGSIYLLRASKDYAEVETSWGEHAAPSHPLLMPHECWGLRRGHPHVSARARDSSEVVCEHIDLPEGIPCHTACLPLTAQGANLGFLYLSAHEASALSVSLAATAAEQLSLALNNLQLQETLRQQSIRDALTGLYNRRYLEESLPREMARADRRGQSLALMMLDLDHFKVFNDTHGHDGGDALLATFGKLLSASCRTEDIACRYGGEEFVLILTEISLEDALRRAETLRSAVETMTVRHLHRQIGGVTVSIGLAMYPDHATDGVTLQRRADLALYRAKRGGRNRVEVAGND